MSKPMHIVVIGAYPQSLSNFRGDLIKALLAQGHRVTAMSAPATEDEVGPILDMGAQHRPFPVERAGLNPIKDVQTLLALRRTFADLKPDLVLAYTVKPVIWSGIALASARSPARFFALITGLGFAFEGKTLGRRTVQAVVKELYRRSLRRAETVVFQNADNRDAFVSNGIVAAECCAVVNGSGVDTDRFATTPLPETGARFLLIARLLGDKGLREYAAAAAIVREEHPEAEFHLVGPPDGSPNAIPLREVERWHQEGTVIYHGAADDVRPHIAACHVYVLPSYHEGMPRSVLEAMAMGRPILTTDIPGCRQTVVPGKNGWLVPKADATALAERMTWFLDHRVTWQEMGQQSRRMAEDLFDAKSVNADMLRIMGFDTSDPDND